MNIASKAVPMRIYRADEWIPDRDNDHGRVLVMEKGSSRVLNKMGRYSNNYSPSGDWVDLSSTELPYDIDPIGWMLPIDPQYTGITLLDWRVEIKDCEPIDSPKPNLETREILDKYFGKSKVRDYKYFRYKIDLEDDGTMWVDQEDYIIVRNGRIQLGVGNSRIFLGFTDKEELSIEELIEQTSAEHGGLIHWKI